MANGNVSFLRWVPLALACLAGVVWGVRLEGLANYNEKRIVVMERQADESDKAFEVMKVEQAKFAGQIDTLKVMIANLAATAERIEKKLDSR